MTASSLFLYTKSRYSHNVSQFVIELMFSCIFTAILDIPIYKNTNHHNERVQALHVLFTLFSEFKNSQVCVRSLR